MTIIVPHQKSKQEVIGIIDRGATDIFGGVAGAPVQIVDPKKDWQGSTMTFSLKGKMGFITVPLSGTVEVDDQKVTIICDLPPMLKNFVGEAKVQSMVGDQVKGLLA